MARLHSKKHGKSSSKKPASKVSPSWVEYPAHEVEDMVVKFAKAGTPPSQIGMKLRDSYGIPSVKNLCGKSVSEILLENKARSDFPEDLINLIKTTVRMRAHLGSNRSDRHNKVKLLHTESKIKRLVKYYTKTERIPPGWEYDPQKAALLVK
jgi:small subunit ribosomal protein S15